VRVDVRSIMGLDIPAADMDIEPADPAYGFSYTSASLDEAREKWLDVLRFVAWPSIRGRLCRVSWRPLSRTS